MWRPVWLIVAVAGGRRMYVAGQPTRSNIGLIIAGLLGGLFLLSLVITHWQAFLGLVALTGLGYLGYRAFIFGDSSGVYGQYPPAQPSDPRR